MIRKLTHVTDYLLTQEMAQEKLEGDPITVTWYTNKANKASVVHSHPYYHEIILPVCGEVLYSARGNLYHMRAGEVICFPAEMYHSGKYDIVPEVSERIVVQIDTAFSQEVMRRTGLAEADWKRDATIVPADAVTAWDVRGLFERMSLTSTMPPEARQDVFAAQLTELLWILWSVTRSGSLEAPTTTSTLVAKAVEFIRENYQNPELSVAMLTEYTFASRGHLSRVFKEYTMESIHSYITNLRMQHCRQAIAEGKTVLDACTESGFSDYSSFLKTFHRLYGISPSEYRQRLKKQPAKQ